MARAVRKGRALLAGLTRRREAARLKFKLQGWIQLVNRPALRHCGRNASALPSVWGDALRPAPHPAPTHPVVPPHPTLGHLMLSVLTPPRSSPHRNILCSPHSVFVTSKGSLLPSTHTVPGRPLSLTLSLTKPKSPLSPALYMPLFLLTASPRLLTLPTQYLYIVGHPSSAFHVPPIIPPLITRHAPHHARTQPSLITLYNNT